MRCIQDFPYYFEPGLQHDNIWCTEELSVKELREVRALIISTRTSTQQPEQVLTAAASVHLADAALALRMLPRLRSAAAAACAQVSQRAQCRGWPAEACRPIGC